MYISSEQDPSRRGCQKFHYERPHSAMQADQTLIAVLNTLWKISPPGPDRLWSSPEFLALKNLLVQRYQNGRSTFGLEVSLGNALRSLGLPCLQMQENRHPPLELEDIASALKREFSRTNVMRRYLCPLDLADDIPTISFGNSKLSRFSAVELENLFDAPRLERHFPEVRLDSCRLSEFHWLIVEEEVAINVGPAGRALPFLDMSIERDLGEIDPYSGRIPAAVESALFFLLLAPWEKWAQMTEVDWRGFHMPWIYTVSEDLCVSPARPPDPDSLSWEPQGYTNEWGETIEYERPIGLCLDDDAVPGILTLTNVFWELVEGARKSDLFNTPVEHFIVRAFLANKIDELMAHLTVVEAAFGTESDHKPQLRPKPDPHKKIGATRRVAARLSAAVGEPQAARDFLNLFDLRSMFVHGRAGLQPISTKDRVMARGLAQGAANALVRLSSLGLSRETLLAQLLDSGVGNLP